MHKHSILLALGLSASLSLSAQADVLAQLQAGYAQQAQSAFSAADGEALWKHRFPDTKSGHERSCTTCHTANLSNTGKHARTGKPIKPMAPSVNPQRLTNAADVKKWLKRNCKWTLGRECTPQEKGDLLAFISGQ